MEMDEKYFGKEMNKECYNLSKQNHNQNLLKEITKSNNIS
jgi:hypothetical protein